MIKNRLLRSFATGIKPERRQEIVEWAKDNVFLPVSKKSDRCDLTLTPWLVGPLQSIIDGDYDHYNFIGATASGKSTLLETLACYLVLEKPSQVAFFHQTETAAKQWMESRLMGTLKKNPKILSLFPTNRHHVKIDTILFPHMNMFVRGSSIANTQSLSLDVVAVDEAWISPQGALQYIQRRTHDRPFSYSVFTSHAGVMDTEFHDWCKDARTFEYHYKCPHCGEYHPWRFDNLKFDKTFSNVYYQCPCGAQLPDTPQIRRQISSEGKYIELPTENPDPKKVSFIFNAGLNFSIEWTKLAREFVKANEEAKKYNFEPLKIFKLQRLCEWWSEDSIDYIPVQKAEYSIKDKEKWSRTFLAIDCQGVPGNFYFWYSVITFKEDGTSRLIDVGMLDSHQSIINKQNEWGIPSNCCVMDAGYDSDTVKDFCGQYGFLAANGVNTLTFPITKSGKLINRLYGVIRAEKTLSGKMCSYCPFSSTRAKTIAAGMRSSGQWQVPQDTPEFALRQLNAERFEDGAWKQIKADNHLIDLYAMTTILALIHKLPINTGDEDQI